LTTLTFEQAMEHEVVVHAVGDRLCCVLWCKLNKCIAFTVASLQSAQVSM